jgi:hypothetical protein
MSSNSSKSKSSRPRTRRGIVGRVSCSMLSTPPSAQMFRTPPTDVQGSNHTFSPMLTDVDVLEPTHLTFESVVADSVNLRSNKLIKDMYTHSVDLDVIKELESLVVEYNEREETIPEHIFRRFVAYISMSMETGQGDSPAKQRGRAEIASIRTVKTQKNLLDCGNRGYETWQFLLKEANTSRPVRSNGKLIHKQHVCLNGCCARSSTFDYGRFILFRKKHAALTNQERKQFLIELMNNSPRKQS